jgi:mevalonate kinase
MAPADEAVGTACGKVILLGEHAVVHGAPAIAAGIARGARARAAAGETESTLTLAGRATVAAHRLEDDVARAFAALLAEAAPGRPVEVHAASDLPAGGGLGSSAALGVAIARAVCGLATATPTATATVIAAANAWERVFHGNPSGIDVIAAAQGGCFRFTRAAGASPIPPRRALVLCVGSSGAASSTRQMVEGVARLFERKPGLKERTLAGVASLVDNAALAIEAGDLVTLGRLMDLNQMLLAGLLVSNEAIEAMCSSARAAGALGAKLTGAGGGGSVIALVPDGGAAEGVLAAWRGAGYDGFVTRVGGEP